MYKVLVDSNIFVDFMFHREPYYNLSEKVIGLCENKKIKGYVTTSILMDLHYIFKRMSHSKANADMAIMEIMKVFDVVDINKKDIVYSISINSKDFEDSIIENCAYRNSLDYIVTRNIKDFENTNIKILMPDELISSIK